MDRDNFDFAGSSVQVAVVVLHVLRAVERGPEVEAAVAALERLQVGMDDDVIVGHRTQLELFMAKQTLEPVNVLVHVRNVPPEVRSLLEHFTTVFAAEHFFRFFTGSMKFQVASQSSFI